MTKYRITRYHGEPEPCAVADPAGCFYSTGEVDRQIDAFERAVDELIALVGLKQDRIMELLEEMRLSSSAMELASKTIGRLKEQHAEAKVLITDMIVWFKWFQPYPSVCVQQFIDRGSKFRLEDDPDEDIHSR